MNKTFVTILIISAFLSCSLGGIDQPVAEEVKQAEETESKLSDVDFPEDFDYETSAKFALDIQENDTDAHYNVYLYHRDLLNPEQYVMANQEVKTANQKYGLDSINLLDEIFSGAAQNGVLQIRAAIPTYTNQIYVRRRVGKTYQGTFFRAEEGVLSLNTSAVGKGMNLTTSKTGHNTYLIAINGTAELNLIDPTTGETVLLDILPEGTNATTYSAEEQVIYALAQDRNFSILRKFDIAEGFWSFEGKAGSLEAQRMTKGPDAKSLYVSNGNRIRVLSKIDARLTGNFRIQGIPESQGGDMTMTPSGELFMATASGVYALKMNGNSFDATKINTEELPFEPTGIAMDEDGMLWISDSEVSASLIQLNPTTGEWNTAWNNLGFAITDLCYGDWSIDIDMTDTDGDGVADSNDEFPADPSLAYRRFIPSKNGWMTFMAEDLWPYLGDYDFNDTTMEYHYEYFLNAQNQLVKTNVLFRVVNDGAGMTNGFGLAMRNFASNQIAQVNGNRLFHNYINLASNGVEANQQDAVLILTDDHSRMGHKIKELSVEFTAPLDAAVYQNFEIDPFLIVNKQREREVHLPFKMPTALGDAQFAKDATSQDTEGNYKTENGLPWAMLLQGSVYVPREKVGIDSVFNYFQAWALSGGQVNQDWYLDMPGYINKDKIK